MLGKLNKRGATGVAYGLVVGLIAIVGLGAITSIGGSVDDLFNTVGGEMQDVVTSTQPSVAPGAAALAASPSSISNADVSGPATPSTGTPVVVTFSNTGGSATGTLATVAASGNYPVTSDNCNGTSLQAGQSCTVEVTPTASTDGALTGQVEVGDGVAVATADFSGTASAFSDTSCAAILASNPSASSGAYSIDPDGAGAGGAFTVQCDMTTDGGGWTRAVLHVDSNSNTMWNMWSNDQNTSQLDGQSANAGLAMSRLSSSSDGSELELMWEVNNSPRRIYRGVPLSNVFNNNTSTNPGAVDVDYKTIGGSYLNFTDPTGQKGGWQNAYYSGGSNGNSFSYHRCGWLWGNSNPGRLYGLSTDVNCGSNTGFNNLTNARVELWLR